MYTHKSNKRKKRKHLSQKHFNAHSAVLHQSFFLIARALTIFYTRGLGKVDLYVMVPQPYSFSLAF